jgi:hypothetical protein
MVRNIALVLMFLLSVLSIGCSNTQGYKRVDIHRWDTTFSFKYPLSYNDSYGSTRSDRPDYESIILFRPPRLSLGDNLEKDINTCVIVYAFKYSDAPQYADAKAKLDGMLLSELTKSSVTLVERSKKQIDGLTGEFSVIRDSNDIYSQFGSGPNVVITRDLFFDYKGRIWYISISSLEAYSVQAEEEFSQIIRSFRFIN